jgi:hypothetical protein
VTGKGGKDEEEKAEERKGKRKEEKETIKLVGKCTVPERRNCVLGWSQLISIPPQAFLKLKKGKTFGQQRGRQVSYTRGSWGVGLIRGTLTRRNSNGEDPRREMPAEASVLARKISILLTGMMQRCAASVSP